jgi:hypothetical protein
MRPSPHTVQAHTAGVCRAPATTSVGWPVGAMHSIFCHLGAVEWDLRSGCKIFIRRGQCSHCRWRRCSRQHRQLPIGANGRGHQRVRTYAVVCQSAFRHCAPQQPRAATAAISTLHPLAAGGVLRAQLRQRCTTCVPHNPTHMTHTSMHLPCRRVTTLMSFSLFARSRATKRR